MMDQRRLLLLAALVVCGAVLAQAMQPVATSAPQAVQPNVDEKDTETGSTTTPLKAKSKKRVYEFEDTDEYVYLVCVRKLLKGPKKFCEKPEIQAIVGELSKVPAPKKMPKKAVFKSHSNGEATQRAHRLKKIRRARVEAQELQEEATLVGSSATINRGLSSSDVAKAAKAFFAKHTDLLTKAKAVLASSSDDATTTSKGVSGARALQGEISLIEQRTTMRTAERMTTPYRNPWKDGIVPYEFEGVGPTEKPALYGLFLEAMWKYQNNTCVRFEPRQADSPHYVVLAGGPDAEGSFSDGAGNESTRVQIGEGMTDSIVVEHEFGHLLGLLHTNKRQDRDGYVIIDRTKCDNNFRKYVKREGEFQLECQDSYQWYRQRNRFRLSGGFLDTFKDADADDIKSAFDTFDAAMTQSLRAARADVVAAQTKVDGLWNLGPINRGKRRKARQELLDAQNMVQLWEHDLALWDKIKRDDMQTCLDGWFEQYDEADHGGKDYGHNYDYMSVMHYAFDLDSPDEEQCMMPKTPNDGGIALPDPSIVGSQPAGSKDFHAVRRNMGCQNTRGLYVCMGSTDSCERHSHRSVHPTWTMKDFMEIMEAQHGFTIATTTLEKSADGNTWSLVDYQDDDTLGGLNLLTQRLRFCDGCNNQQDDNAQAGNQQAGNATAPVNQPQGGDGNAEQ